MKIEKDLFRTLNEYEGMSFPEISSAHDGKTEISKQYWMSFPQFGLNHHPKNLNFAKIVG